MSPNGAENTLDLEERIAQTGCVPQYTQLEDCLYKYNREWKQCQGDLKEFAKCMDRNKKAATSLPEQK